jgi:hypothetical protein
MSGGLNLASYEKYSFKTGFMTAIGFHKWNLTQPPNVAFGDWPYMGYRGRRRPRTYEELELWSTISRRQAAAADLPAQPRRDAGTEQQPGCGALTKPKRLHAVISAIARFAVCTAFLTALYKLVITLPSPFPCGPDFNSASPSPSTQGRPCIPRSRRDPRPEARDLPAAFLRSGRPGLGPGYVHLVQRTVATRLTMAAKHLSVYS